MTAIQELLKVPATSDDVSQQLSRVNAMLHAAFHMKRIEPPVVILLPRALLGRYGAKIRQGNDQPLFARGHSFTFAEMPLVPHDQDQPYIIAAAKPGDVQPRQFEYPSDPMHTKG